MISASACSMSVQPFGTDQVTAATCYADGRARNKI
jgi:hypothetical protein